MLLLLKPALICGSRMSQEAFTDEPSSFTDEPSCESSLGSELSLVALSLGSELILVTRWFARITSQLISILRALVSPIIEITPFASKLASTRLTLPTLQPR